MCVCVCVHIPVCIYICVCVYTYTCVYVCVCTYTCMCIYLCVYTYTCVYMCVYIYLCVYMCVCIHIPVCVYVCVHILVCVCVCMNFTKPHLLHLYNRNNNNTYLTSIFWRVNDKMCITYITLGLAGKKTLSGCYLLSLLNHSAWLLDCYNLSQHLWSIHLWNVLRINLDSQKDTTIWPVVL